MSGGGSRPLRPRITVHPDPTTTETTALFDISQPGRPAARAHPGFTLHYECRFDDQSWVWCALPETMTGIRRGTHRFAVRAVNRAGATSPIADFVWRRAREAKPPTTSPPPPARRSGPGGPASAVLPPVDEPPATEPPAELPVEEPEPPPAGAHFRISQVGTLGELFPGAPAETIGVRIENPNPYALTLTSLTATIAAAPADCPPAENFVLTPAPVSPAAPIALPPESTVSLPEAGIAGPTIAMVNLPISQDSCQAAELEIALSGEATG